MALCNFRSKLRLGWLIPFSFYSDLLYNRKIQYQSNSILEYSLIYAFHLIYMHTLMLVYKIENSEFIGIKS